MHEMVALPKFELTLSHMILAHKASMDIDGHFWCEIGVSLIGWNDLLVMGTTCVNGGGYWPNVSMFSLTIVALVVLVHVVKTCYRQLHLHQAICLSILCPRENLFHNLSTGWKCMCCVRYCINNGDNDGPYSDSCLLCCLLWFFKA